MPVLYMEKSTPLAKAIGNMPGFDPDALPQVCLADPFYQVVMQFRVIFKLSDG
jgi:hypothetical protein